MTWRQLVFATLLALLVPAGWAQDWTYTIRPGDELWNIAAKYCGSAKFAARLAAHNKLDDPKQVRAGTRINIPIDWLVRQPAQARVVSAYGTAHLYAPEQRPAEVGQQVGMGHSIETAEGSVAVQFADDSLLMIAPESRVLFNVLTAFGDTGMVDTNLRFYRGRGTSKIIRRHGASSFRISTPSGTAAVRGTEFRVGVEPEVSYTETLSGEVGYITSSETSVPAGFGIAASSQGVAKEALLPAPGWISQPGAIGLGQSVRWQPLANAEGYRASVYRAQDTRTAVAEVVTPDSEYVVQALTPGDYLISVRGISARGIEGFEEPLALTVRGAPPLTRSTPRAEAGNVQLEWRPTSVGAPYVVQVAASDAFAGAAEYSSRAAQLTLPDLTPGTYRWRVRDQQSVFSEPPGLSVRPRAVADLEVESALLQLTVRWEPVAGADAYRVEISREPDFARIVYNKDGHETGRELALQEYGVHYVRVTALSGGLQSDPAQRQFELRPKPLSWLWSLLILPLFAL